MKIMLLILLCCFFQKIEKWCYADISCYELSFKIQGARSLFSCG